MTSAFKALCATASRDGWALITGASSGIGAAYARALLHLGWGVLLTSEDALDLAIIADGLRKHSDRVQARAYDLCSAEGVASLLLWCSPFTVDVLINNAGIGFKGAFLSNSGGQYRRLLELNVLAPVTIARELLPGMRTVEHYALHLNTHTRVLLQAIGRALAHGFMTSHREEF